MILRYEDYPIIGHRLYREIRKIEVKNKTKGKGRFSLPVVNCQWETIATNFDEFRAIAVSNLIDGHLILFTIFVISFTIRSLKGSNCEQFPCDFYSIENNRLK